MTIMNMESTLSITQIRVFVFVNVPLLSQVQLTSKYFVSRKNDSPWLHDIVVDHVVGGSNVRAKGQLQGAGDGHRAHGPLAYCGKCRGVQAPALLQRNGERVELNIIPSTSCLFKASCLLDPVCLSSLSCKDGCQGDSLCDWECGEAGLLNPAYTAMLTCWGSHYCQETRPSHGGACAATSVEEGDKTITSLAQIAGSWWIIRHRLHWI